MNAVEAVLGNLDGKAAAVIAGKASNCQLKCYKNEYHGSRQYKLLPATELLSSAGAKLGDAFAIYRYSVVGDFSVCGCTEGRAQYLLSFIIYLVHSAC